MNLTAPRTGKDLILATRPFAVEQRGRSWFHLVTTVIPLGLALAGTLVAPGWFLPLASGVLAGLLILRLFVIYHDQQHHAIFEHSPLVGAFMWLFGVWSLSPSSIWRLSHNHHHNHNSRLRGSQIGSFPILTADAYRNSSPKERVRYLATRHPLTLLLGYGPVFLWGMCLRPFLARPSKHWDGLLAIVVHVAVAVALVSTQGWKAWFLFQTVPCLTACAAGAYLFYVQHNFPGVRYREKATWNYEAAALESSSFLKLGAMGRWFTANIGFHHVHHLNSRIPFYRLPEAMRALPELQHPGTTSLSPGEILRCLRLKVWDADLGRMTAIAR